MKLLDEATGGMGKGKTLPGDVAFKLYDTFGFPYDLTEDALRRRGIGVDKAGFDVAMAKQKEEARAAWKGSGEAATESVWFELREKIGASEFLGYDTEVAEGVVTALVKGGKPVASLNAGDEGQVVVNQTPFYGESGGQVGDEGAMFTGTGAEFAVSDTQKKLGDMHVHVGKLNRGTLKVGDVVDLRVDGVRRTATRANHSATHLLHEALRRVLGPHVTQKGSLVGPDKLRFDFSHPKAVSEAETARDRGYGQRHGARERRRRDAADDAGEGDRGQGRWRSSARSTAMKCVCCRWARTRAGLIRSNSAAARMCGGSATSACSRSWARARWRPGVRRVEALTGAGALAYLNEHHRLVREAAAAMKRRRRSCPSASRS